MNILYIEDNPLNFRLVQKMLKHQHTVFGAMSGLDGLKEARELMPDLILLDINLPDFDGFKVQEQLRADSRFNHIPIIAHRHHIPIPISCNTQVKIILN